MTRKQKHLLTRIIVAAVLFLAGSLLHLPEYIEMGVFLACYAVVGWDIVWKAITNILNGQVFDENFLMTIATIGALILGEHSEGVAVMLFYQVGEWFQSYAVSKSRKSIASLMDIRPDYANIEKDGKLVQVDPDEVQIGDTIVVKPGERIPLDGKIIKGFSALDTSALTGESMPREVEPGMEVISGCINQTGILTIQTTKEFGESTVAKILDLVENASDKKGRIENFITRFARYYTPVVVFAALALAILPPLITGQPFSTWIYRALTFLVISCPCALVISIPLSFFGGIGGASKIGVLVKGSNYLEALAHTEVVVFDKTGTLTKGSFAVSEIHPVGMEEAQLLELAAYAEDYSNHPISLSIKQAYGQKIDSSRISEVQEIAGHGVRAVIDGKTVLAGNAKLMDKEHIKYTPSASVGTVVYAFNTKADDIPKNMPPANVYRQFMIEKISTNVNATSIFDRRILDFGTAVTSIVFKVSFCSSIEKSITRIMENKKGATRKLPNKIFIPTRLRKRYPLCKQSAKENVGISTPTNMIIRTVFCLFTFRNSFK